MSWRESNRTRRFGIILALAILGFAIFLSLSVRPAAARPPFRDVRYDMAASNDTVLCVWADTDFKVIGSGSTSYVEVVVRDMRNIPIEGATVTVNLLGAGNVQATAPTDADGKTSFVYAADNVDREGKVWLVVNAAKADYTSGQATISLTVLPPAAEIPADSLWLAGVAAAVVGSGIAGTEVGKYGLMRLLFPLYTRVRKEEVLDHFVRGQIYGFIVANPGNHYNAIRLALSLNNGTLAHHLRTLEMQGFVKSRRDGTFKRFYPVNVMIPQEGGIKLSEMQLEILDLIRQTGVDGATQKFIADILGISQQTASYNLKVLERSGAVRMETDGRRTRYMAGNGNT
ncbi:MAG: helix-turn-helix domain-containing protein [Euryarchaeota archaeon]|nr:helix-turn-helix domain-containing protein [Euryarchaeota archaeon]